MKTIITMSILLSITCMVGCTTKKNKPVLQQENFGVHKSHLDRALAKCNQQIGFTANEPEKAALMEDCMRKQGIKYSFTPIR